MGENGLIKSPEEVLNEIKKKDDNLSDWIKDRASSIFEKEIEGIQGLVVEILADHPRLLDTKKGRSGADVWVIAFAEFYGGIAVSDETKRTNTGKSPKIPDVCEFRGVNHMDTIAFIRAVGLSFEHFAFSFEPNDTFERINSGYVAKLADAAVSSAHSIACSEENRRLRVCGFDSRRSYFCNTRCRLLTASFGATSISYPASVILTISSTG